MKLFAKKLKTVAAAVILGLPAFFAQADLSQAEIDTINGKSGIRV